MHRAAATVVAVAALALLVAGAASARLQPATSFASAEIATVVDAGLMGPSVDAFRPEDPLTASELATVIASLGGAISIADPNADVTVRELDARLVSLAGLRPAAQAIRLAALGAGLGPRPWLGTETIARMLGFRINHPRTQEELELQVSQPVTRAEAAFSIAVYLALDEAKLEAVRVEAEAFSLPALTEWQRVVLARALRFVGSPYVWAGTSERPQQLFGRTLPGGFDCSGFVWRVYKLQAFTEAPGLSRVLTGRTSYAMSGEVRASARVPRDALQPGDVVFFGARGTRSKPPEVGHMGIYVGNDWIVHSSRFGTTLTPMTGWYETTFAWGRSPLVEAGLEY
jgi:cell wall-associated NlpC family hydrolase